MNTLNLQKIDIAVSFGLSNYEAVLKLKFILHFIKLKSLNFAQNVLKGFKMPDDIAIHTSASSVENRI